MNGSSEGVGLPAVRDARDGYVASTPPLLGKDQAERDQKWALAEHRFQKHSDRHFRKQLSLLKLDSRVRCRHTRLTVTRPTRTLELVSPFKAQLVSAPFIALVMFVSVIILILPR
jgi:hypothetical protein